MNAQHIDPAAIALPPTVSIEIDITRPDPHNQPLLHSDEVMRK